VPYLGNLRCGYGSANDPGDAYEAIVYSAEQQPGCGVNGSVVTFKLLDAQGNVIAVANEKATWHAWDGLSEPQRLDLTFGPATVITMPGTGAGDASPGEASVWGRLSLLLGFVGLAGAALGLSLRKRATTRRATSAYEEEPPPLRRGLLLFAVLMGRYLVARKRR